MSNELNSKAALMTEEEITKEWPWIRYYHIGLWLRKRCLALGRDKKGKPKKLTVVKDRGRNRRFHYYRSELEKINSVPKRSHRFRDGKHKERLWRDHIDAEITHGLVKQSLTWWRKNGFPLWPKEERQLQAQLIVMRCQGGYFREIWFYLASDLKEISKLRDSGPARQPNNGDERADKEYVWGADAERINGLKEETLKVYTKRQKRKQSSFPLLGRPIEYRLRHRLLPRYRIWLHGDHRPIRRALPRMEWLRTDLEELGRKRAEAVDPELLGETEDLPYTRAIKDLNIPDSTARRYFKNGSIYSKTKTKPKSKLTQLADDKPERAKRVRISTAKHPDLQPKEVENETPQRHSPGPPPSNRELIAFFREEKRKDASLTQKEISSVSGLRTRSIKSFKLTIRSRLSKAPSPNEKPKRCHN
jgi:hypothetical protein